MALLYNPPVPQEVLKQATWRKHGRKPALAAWRLGAGIQVVVARNKESSSWIAE